MQINDTNENSWVSTANGIDRHVVDCRRSHRGRRIWNRLSGVVAVVAANSPTAEQDEEADRVAPIIAPGEVKIQ